MTAPPAWEAHPPSNLRRDEVDLLAARTVAGSWLSPWADEPERPVLRDDATGWLTAAALEARSRKVAAAAARAAFLAGAGLARHVETAAATLGEDAAAHPLDRLTSARNPPGPACLDLLAPDAPALLVYTSGTTGKPRRAPLTQANLPASAEALRTAGSGVHSRSSASP